MNKALRVLHVTTAISGDGASRALLALLNHPDRSWQAKLCVLRSTPEAEILPEVQVLGKGRRASTVAAWLHLARILHAWRPHVIHTQLSRADWIGRAAGARFKIPVVTTMQNVHSRMYRAEFSPLAAWIGRAMDRTTVPLAACVVAVSAAVAADARRAGVRSVEVIPNGLDLNQLSLDASRDEARRMLAVDPGDFVIIALSLLKKQKGIDTLVHAATGLGERGAGMRALIFGEGDQRAEIEELIQKAAPGGMRVELRGWVPQARHWLRGADAYVMPSRWEGLPVALLEAMARGLPCLVTAAPGIEDIVSDQANGWVVPADNPAALADGLARLMERRAEAHLLGQQAARDVAERFNIVRTVQAYTNLFERLEVAEELA